MENQEYKISSDHDEIKNWIEERGGCPALINSEENEGRGLLAIQFGESDTALEPLSWQEFFDTLDSLELALRYDTTGEEKGMFAYSFISREQEATEAEDSATLEALPEDTVPVENMFPSAPVFDADAGVNFLNNPDFSGGAEGA